MKTVEYGTSKSFYPNITRDVEWDRMSWREKMIELITSMPARNYFKHFPLFVVCDNETGIFEWNLSALESDDDMNLTFKYNICNNTKNKL